MARKEMLKWFVTAFIAGLIIFGVMAIIGCTSDGGLSPELTELFDMSNDAAQVANEECIENPDTCAEGLSEVAEEFQMWADIFQGWDPNGKRVD